MNFFLKLLFTLVDIQIVGFEDLSSFLQTWWSIIIFAMNDNTKLLNQLGMWHPTQHIEFLSWFSQPCFDYHCGKSTMDHCARWIHHQHLGSVVFLRLLCIISFPLLKTLFMALYSCDFWMLTDSFSKLVLSSLCCL